MIVRLVVFGVAGLLLYSCARDQAKQEMRREQALEHRVHVLERKVQALEKGQRPAPPAAP